VKFEIIETYPQGSLIEFSYKFQFDKEDLPFEWVMVPRGISHFYYVYSEKDIHIIRDNTITNINNLVVQGPNYGGFKVFIEQPTTIMGVALAPTTLYKLTGKSTHQLLNSFVPLDQYNSTIAKFIEPIYLKHQSDKQAFSQQIYARISELKSSFKNRTNDVEKALEIIHSSNGIISIDTICKSLNLSRRSLNYNFKKMAGMTVGKYIRRYRFSRLIFDSKEQDIDFNELMGKFNYYDQSHFVKDFKFFTLQNPSKYFNRDFEFISRFVPKEIL
tara:strand:- start:463107 stop:463925 length:819 start_codon:yes stop_codon:yes gene_type:complete